MTSPPDHRLCIAPMMSCTDRHFRYLLRLLSPNVMLYTEMITTGALIHGDASRYLAFDHSEHPVAVQLGGADPAELQRCALLAADAGFDEINLNAGCPSDRVQNGGFGACLMADPRRLADCVAATVEASPVPVTVKLRTGVDDLDSDDYLAGLVHRLAAAGCRTFIIHARKAWLSGLSPSQNRSIPPLQYQRVYRIKREFPSLEIIINGGLQALDAILDQYRHVDGVMVGRLVRQDPCQLARLDAAVFGAAGTDISRKAVLGQYLRYMEKELSAGTEFSHMARHLLGLFRGLAGARAYRRILGENLHRRDSGLQLISDALQSITQPC